MQEDNDFIIGDLVYVSKFRTIATIVSFNTQKKYIKVSLNNDLVISVLLSEVTKTKLNQHKVCIYNNFDQIYYLKEKNLFSNFHTEVDLHGYRAKEAIEYLEALVEKALYYRENELIIIHGKGSGILRQIVKDFVRNKKILSLSILPPHICEDSAICIKITAK